MESPSDAFSNIPQHISDLVIHGYVTSRLTIMFDTIADVSVIGPQFLDSLGIPRRHLHPPQRSTILTEDRSEIALALSIFIVTLILGKRSCFANIRVHEGIQAPFVS